VVDEEAVKNLLVTKMAVSEDEEILKEVLHHLLEEAAIMETVAVADLTDQTDLAEVLAKEALVVSEENVEKAKFILIQNI
jgi:hypothetical protein